MRSPTVAVVGALVALATLTACSSSTAPASSAVGPTASRSSGDTAVTPDAGSTGASTSSAPTGSPGPTTVRFGYFYIDKNLMPGPAIDIYDTQEGLAARPLVTDLAYGSFSDYVHPQESGTIPQAVVSMYALPTGEDPVANKADAVGVGGYQDDGSKLQETLIVDSEGKGGSASLETGPLGGLSFRAMVEKGDDAEGRKAPVAPPAPTGQGELLVTTHVAEDEGLESAHGNVDYYYYFFIDASCTPPINGDSLAPGLPELFNSATSTIKSEYASSRPVPVRIRSASSRTATG